MLKHATICRTNRAQQAIREQWDIQSPALDVVDHSISTDGIEDLHNIESHWLTNTRVAAPCSSPTPTLPLVTTPLSRSALPSGPTPSAFSSPSKSSSSYASTTQPTAHRSTAESMIKIFAQTLSQEVEYVTLHLNAQTKSQQIIRTLLKKFRLKHRDPNLFYLTLERWIRKDGLKFKSVMLLGDDACPLQLQQCCSNPPHNDIKFTLQMRTGALMKIFCSEVCSETKYKCLSLSSQTTVEETIGLMLHCLNLTIDCESKRGNGTITQDLNTTSAVSNHHHRQASSPSSTESSSSSASSTSSSSGIESDLMNQNTCPSKIEPAQHQAGRQLDANSRTSSITSISSASNLSNTSCSQSFSEHYCLVIECASTNYKRVLEADDILVEVYQSLLDVAHDQPEQSLLVANEPKPLKSTSTSSIVPNESMKQQPDQLFVIKLKRRVDLDRHNMKFTSPRRNMPLPPVPTTLAQFNTAAAVNNLQFFVSTTKIEVNHHQRRVSSSLAGYTNRGHIGVAERNGGATVVNDIAGQSNTSAVATACSRPVNCHQKQMSAIVSSSRVKMPPPPETLIWLPPIRPRRRNLSNASTTFGRPQNGLATSSFCNKRRYDPAQLADDLNQLNLGSTDGGESRAFDKQVRPDNLTSDTSLDLKPVIEQTRSEGTTIETQSQSGKGE